MDEVKQRLLQFAKSQQLIMGDFYEKILISQSNFSGKGANSALSTDKIIHILNAYPELSTDWLLLGKGKMMRKGEVVNSTTMDDTFNSASIWRDILADKDLQLAQANQTIGQLRYQLDQVQNQLHMPGSTPSTSA